MQCLARAGHLAGGQLKAIEAAAREEEDLITTHVAGGAQLPLELIAFAQQPALSIAAPLTGPWKLSSDQVETREVGRELLDLMDRREHHAEAPGCGTPRSLVGEPPLESQDETAHAGRGYVVPGISQVPPVVSDHPAVTQQLARHTLVP